MSKQDLKLSADEEFTLNFEKNKNKNKWKDAIFLLDDTRASRKAYERFKRKPYYTIYNERLRDEGI